VIVQVTLRANDTETISIQTRVDSGSSFCVFGRQWADLLGLDWEAGDPIKLSTAAGTFYAHLHEVTIQLLDFKWSASVAFAEWDTMPPSPARDVLGLNGFFDHFLVAIDDTAEMLYLEPRFF
jgi:Aspartyl protease